MAIVKSSGVGQTKPLHGPGKIRTIGSQNEVIVLCEVIDYVKLSSLLSLLSFIFLSLFSYLLHIIGAFLQAHRAIVRHRACVI